MPAPIVMGAAAIAARLAAKKAAQEAAKKATKKATEKIAKNSVKTRPQDSIKRLQGNVGSYYKTVKAKSGATAKEDAAEMTKNIKQNLRGAKPAVVKINSAAKAKSADAAKSKNAKALKAANKKGKR
jgi:hypothetical protein